MDIATQLDKLADLRGEIVSLNTARDADRAKVLKPVQGKLDAVEKKYSGLLEKKSTAAEALESEIKAAILKLRESVKGTKLHAIYISGRVSWDSKGLDGFRVAHPEISTFRKEGDPSVTIREIKSAEKV